MGNLLGILLGTETEAALEVFLTLRKASNQREALNAAAKHKLSGKEKQVFEAILQVYSSLENQRNDLAHGCFGICPDDADILFWIELKHHIHFQVEVLANEANGKFENDRHARLKPHLFAYRKSDLESLYSQMEEFWRIIFYFNGYLRNPSDLDRQAEYHRLQAFQLIKNALKK
ncbi:hypothetical protein ABD07_07345 [Nitrosomonas oligotropha]|nr:hypothetical protein [Nitrosomonas oligotropha]